jgi:pyridoxal phosphate enzyme (YggS family)
MLIFYTMGILQNLSAVQEKIYKSAVKAGRDPRDIKLVAVTKTVELQEIIKAVKAGVTILGESRVQEAQRKVESYELRVMSEKIEWHLIGNLQRNKAKYAVRLFDLIHTIDSIELAEELNKQAEKAGKVQRVLVQVKLSDESTKHGVSENDLTELLEQVNSMGNLGVEGLMTIPPFFEDPEKACPYFKRLREIRDRVAVKGFKVPELSMGMSNDFEVAIKEGATMVRIGTAIFGER